MDSAASGHENRCMAAILGIDVGTKTLGLAVSDAGQSVAFTLRTLQRRGLKRDLEELTTVLQERESTEVVIGLPLNLDGSAGAMTAEADLVASGLIERGFTVHRWDERLSTVAAERALLEGDVSRKKRRDVIDKVAAALILQGFLDRRQQAVASRNDR